MIIHTDVDGVLADFVGGLCDELSRQGMPRTPDEIEHWDLALSLSSDEMKAVHRVMSEPGWCYGLAWYEGAREFVRGLGELGHVHALTAPFRDAPGWMHERLTWLASEIPGDRVHFVSGKFKHLVRGDVLVEDHPKTACDWAEANPDGVALLVHRPWNTTRSAEWACHRNVYRVRSYAEALNFVKELA